MNLSHQNKGQMGSRREHEDEAERARDIQSIEMALESLILEDGEDGHCHGRHELPPPGR